MKIIAGLKLCTKQQWQLNQAKHRRTPWFSLGDVDKIVGLKKAAARSDIDQYQTHNTQTITNRSV